MQYVKQVRYYQASTDAERAAAIDQTLSRKVRDAKCAIDLEKKYSKDDILDGYFNIAFLARTPMASRWQPKPTSECLPAADRAAGRHPGRPGAEPIRA